MKRTYTSVSDFRAPYDSVPFAGLGATRRSYEDVSNFRAPYDNGYFQNNTLFGLGAAATASSGIVPNPNEAPAELQAYLASGRPMGTARRDLGSALNQVPRWVYAVLGAGALYLAWKSYQGNKQSSARRELEGARTLRSAELSANYRRNKHKKRRRR